MLSQGAEAQIPPGGLGSETMWVPLSTSAAWLRARTELVGALAVNVDALRVFHNG